MNFTPIVIGDAHYPHLLAEIQNPPRELYVRGELPDFSVAVAIVGTRKATREGKELAAGVARDIVRAGAVVVSGLAMGIDTAAHKGALEAGGRTIAVLGNGIDSVYPAQNERLAERIIKEGGAVVSEYGPGEPSYPGRFIERNRIISGLCAGVVIIEAPARSGALATARFAGEQGRSVFVFPASPRNAHYAGSHALIRDGATLVTSAQEILDDMGIAATPGSTPAERELDANEERVVSTLKQAGGALNIDTIIEHTTLEPHMVSRILTTLAIEGIIQETEAGYEISNR